MFQVHAIPAFSDNYIWCIHNTDRDALVIDPGCAQSVNRFLTEQNLKLKAILITHHHPDHIGGVKQLKQDHKPEIYGFRNADLTFLDHVFLDRDQFTVLGIRFSVIEVPGHTLDHIAFYSETPMSGANISTETNQSSLLQPCLFCGDTLFSGGCGRIFEGTAAQMFNSLEKLCALPDETSIFCAHEYTLNNLKFARSVMPTNPELTAYIQDCKSKRERDLPTLPSTLKIEHAINPFLRCRDPEIITNLREHKLIKDDTPVEIFTALRRAKDHF